MVECKAQILRAKLQKTDRVLRNDTKIYKLLAKQSCTTLIDCTAIPTTAAIPTATPTATATATVTATAIEAPTSLDQHSLLQMTKPICEQHVRDHCS